MTKRPEGVSAETCSLIAFIASSSGKPARMAMRNIARTCTAANAGPMPWPVASAMSSHSDPSGASPTS